MVAKIGKKQEVGSMMYEVGDQKSEICEALFILFFAVAKFLIYHNHHKRSVFHQFLISDFILLTSYIIFTFSHFQIIFAR